jgi:hypothetical protein
MHCTPTLRLSKPLFPAQYNCNHLLAMIERVFEIVKKFRGLERLRVLILPRRDRSASEVLLALALWYSVSKPSLSYPRGLYQCYACKG